LLSQLVVGSTSGVFVVTGAQELCKARWPETIHPSTVRTMTEKAALTFITHRTTTGSEKQDPTAIFLYFKNIKKIFVLN